MYELAPGWTLLGGAGRNVGGDRSKHGRVGDQDGERAPQTAAPSGAGRDFLVAGRIARACLEHLGVLLHAVGSTSCYPGPAHGPMYRVDLCSESTKLPGREMRDLRPDEAAAMLRVSPDTLRAWEQRFGYPHSVSGGAGQRRYPHREVIALRNTLDAGLSVAAAVNKARRVSTRSRAPRRR